jgi:hypothetical protein
MKFCKLTFDRILDKYLPMETTVSTLLREFPKVRRVALSGETVIIKTREGDLRLSKDESSKLPVLGRLRGRLLESDDGIDAPTSSDADWQASS